MDIHPIATITVSDASVNATDTVTVTVEFNRPSRAPRRPSRHRCPLTPGLVYQTGTASVSGNTYTASLRAVGSTTAARHAPPPMCSKTTPATVTSGASASVNTDTIAHVIKGSMRRAMEYGPGDTVEIVANAEALRPMARSGSR